MRKAGKTAKKIIFLMCRHFLAIATSAFMATISVAITLYIPILVGQAIDYIVQAGDVDFTRVGQILIRILVCIGIGAMAQWIMAEMNNRITFSVIRDLRNDVFRHMQILPLKYLDHHPHGDTVSRIIADVDTFADGLLLGFTQLFTGIMTIIGTLLLMLYIHWQIALVVVLITPLSLAVATFIAGKTHAMFAAQAKIRGEQTALVDEMIGQIKVVQAFGKEDAMLKQFDEKNQELENASVRAIFFSSLTNPGTRFVYSIVYAGVAFVGAMISISGGITVGLLMSFLSYANQYTKPFNEISGVIAEMQNALACAERIFALLDEPSEKADLDVFDAKTVLNGDVKIRDLEFSYDPHKPLLSNINLSVQPGKRIAIVGPTGCGKTTLINLLMRFYEPKSGSVSIDNINILHMKRNFLRSNVGMVLQDTWLKAGTIRQNITMAKPDATEEEVIEAAKKAHAHSFIKRLPQGYDTVIGESGGTLSQGQKQLLCIARVMLCLPPILILDEATSSIDTRTEIQIQRAFSAMIQGRTSFIVAHRLSTIQEADVILVMQDGKIVEQGNHTSLLAANGFYAELYYSQFRML